MLTFDSRPFEQQIRRGSPHRVVVSVSASQAGTFVTGGTVDRFPLDTLFSEKEGVWLKVPTLQTNTQSCSQLTIYIQHTT